MIQVGQVLDKYELLERVGQGGMAVVYRGIDRSLKRTVAVKILHKHLSDYQEARDRFEREAQAVAKLRHENILEIFDYAAKPDSEAYIVTEFIEGLTLKQFVTERPIAYPEIGAMVMLQVARALAHAHAAGVLHRDVKPENIMIRSDGIVKLMDFGISHMVDLERLTVTGQLLGSPAYMAPEHVEGRPLDFRTDVFAVGIVLYQLTVGKLPFEGKNPHEVLKKIAECRFIDPRQANPRIGNRLGRIILRAMAAEPKDRYAAIGEMVIALENYLEESGLAADKVPSELARYFKAPVPYEESLKVRLLDHLTRKGQELLAGDDRAGALDVFDRVLTIDPENAKVLVILDGLNRRARLKTGAIAVAVAAVLVAGGYKIHLRAKPPEVAALRDVSASSDPLVYVPSHLPGPDDPPPALADAPGPDTTQVAIVAAHIDAGPEVVTAIDAPPAAQPVEVSVSPWKDSQYRVDKAAWLKVPSQRFTIDIDHPVEIEVKNPRCLPNAVQLDPKLKEASVALQFKPARVKPTCDKDVLVSIDNKSWTLGEGFELPFELNAMTSEKTVTVRFTGERVDTQVVTVKANETREVKCDLR